jgi:hypothetical protein
MEGLRFIAYLLEAVAIVAGFYFLRHKPLDTVTRYFVYFLVLTFSIETIGHIPTLIYYYEELHFLKDTFWAQNFWLFNPYLILSFLVYINYFKWKINSLGARKILNILSVFYLVTAIGNLIFSDVFFTTFSSYTYMMGTLLVFLSISYYYYEILTSDRILVIKNSISFYISVAALIFHLVSTPLFIYFKYFDRSLSPEFINFYLILFMSVNIFMYTCFSIGFAICSQKKNSY